MRDIKEKGITLIALVITIIVLLILAGVTIGMITEENGIIRQAKEAKEQTEIASIEEAIDLAALAAEMSDDPEQALIDELNKYFGEGGYIIDGDPESGWTVTVGDVIQEIPAVNKEIDSTDYTITVNKEGEGEIQVNPTSDNGKYKKGTKITLTATETTGYTFSGWYDGSTLL